MCKEAAMPKISNIVLVHGGFVDGAGWRGVYDILKKDGFNVGIVQNPTISLAGDVSATKLVIDSQPGPVILVGHSYGGVVITEAGTDPKVAGLVYITAFAPDKGESVNTLIANPPPGAPVPPILPPKDGYLFLDKAKFAASFAGDVDPKTAAFMAESQVPWGRRRPWRRGHRAGLELQAKLVSPSPRRQDDSLSGTAIHGETGRRHHRRGAWQSRYLCLQSQGRRRPDPTSRERHQIGHVDDYVGCPVRGPLRPSFEKGRDLLLHC
jgi:pimeloyl-ACP methyl ester carboxylesterase